MKRFQEGEWHVFEEESRKPFERLKVDATRALMNGLSGLVTVHRWNGAQLQVNAAGSDATLDFDHGRIICRVRLRSLPATLPFMRNKILSDVEAAVRDVSGVIDTGNKEVFIVHGHNLRAKLELKDHLAKLGVHPIILDEQDDLGMTIIEKFEYYACTCSFAFVLMTPDDSAKAESEIEAKWRARQNVIMELGWFMARLGRKRVVILYQGQLEIPSDIFGVVFIKYNLSIAEAGERIRQRLAGVALI